MTDTAQDVRHVRPGRQRISLAIAVGLCMPGAISRLAGVHGDPGVMAVVYGLTIVGAAFMLSWAAEVAQLDISAGLAIALLSFIAVLPEYAVDMVFAWKGGNAFQEFGPSCIDPNATGESPCSLALANMTGANRLLIGIGWSMVVFLAWFAMRRQNRAAPAGTVTTPLKEVSLERTHSVELAFLTLASAYSLTLPLKRSITLIDAAILVSLFILYTVRISRAPAEEPHLVGPALYIGTFEQSSAGTASWPSSCLRRRSSSCAPSDSPSPWSRPAPSSASVSSSWSSGWPPWRRRPPSCWWPASTPGASTPTPASAPSSRPRSINGRSSWARCPSSSPSPRAASTGFRSWPSSARSCS